MDASKTLSGAQLLSCELDDACPSLDCDALVIEYKQVLQADPEAAEVIAHFCGLGYVDKLKADQTIESSLSDKV